MSNRRIAASFLILELLLILPTARMPNPMLEDSTSSIDMNALMFTKFQEWDGMVTRWTSTNGSGTDPYEVNQCPEYAKINLHGYNSLVPLMSFYEATQDDYYLRKIQLVVDQMISDPWFKTAVSGVGEIHYAKCNWFDDAEHDSAAIITMPFGTASVKLYQWTGEARYKTLADEIASETLKLVVVNNATDMAWSWAYYANRDETNAKIGVNRQGSIAVFYGAYGSIINATFLSYVPKIVNWMWRAQLASNALAYSIGGTGADVAYTGYSMAHALDAYQYSASQFDATLRTKMNNTLTWLRTGIHGGNNFHYNNIYIIASVYASAVKSEFYTPTQDFLNTTKTVIYTALQMLNVRLRGQTTSLDYYPYGFRWGQFFVGYFFSTYKLPSTLTTYFNPIFGCETGVDGQLGRAKLIGAGFTYIYGLRYCFGDLGLRSGIYGQSYITTWTSYRLATYTRSITAEPGFLKAWANSTSPALKVLQYFYPSGLVFANVTGNGSPRIDTTFVDNAVLIVENGTVCDLATMTNGTKLLSNAFCLVRNVTGTVNRETQFVYTTNTDSWLFTRYASVMSFKASSLTNYQMTAMSLFSLKLFNGSAIVAFPTLKSFVMQHHSLAPMPYDTQLELWKTSLNNNTAPQTWLDTYKTAVGTTPRLIAHNKPETVYLTEWDYHSSKLTFEIAAPPGTASITKIHCSRNGEPEMVWVRNGTVIWNYSHSTNILTLNVTHSGRAEITVDWRIPGDVNADDKVDVGDIYRIGRAYDSGPEQPGWDPEIDLNKDNIVNALDLSIVSENYGRRKSEN